MRSIALLGALATACSAPTQAPATPPAATTPTTVETPETAAEPSVAPRPQAQSPGQGFRAPVVEAVRVTTTTDVTVKLERADDYAPWSGPVRYTAEPFTITGRPSKGFVRERNVLGSKRALDLNGDGDTRDRFAAGCQDATFTFGELALSPVMAGPAVLRQYAYAAQGEPRIAALGERGASAMLYLPCADTGVSLGWAPEPIEVREIPGPALMVLAFGNPALAPSIPSDGVTRTPKTSGLADQRFDVEVYEAVAKTPHWYAVAGAMVQLDPEAEEQTVRVFIEGDVEHVQIAINEGKPGVDRARSFVATQTVGSR